MELLLAPLFVALLLAVVPKQFVRLAGIIGTLVILGITIGHVVTFLPNNVVSVFNPNATTKFGLTFKMGYDGIGLFMVILTNALIPVILLSNFNRSIAHEKSFNAMVIFMQFAMTGLFLAMDGIVFYVFWEMTLIPIFLILLWFGAPERKVILTKFFVYTFVGSLGMLLSLIALSSLTDDFSYESLLAIKLVPKSAFWIMSGFFLAFAIKIPVFPFHTWQPDTYTVAPVAGTMLLSALMLNMALFGMVKWMIPIAPEALNQMKFLIISLGIIGVVYAGVIAIKQQDIKRIFAYASISHVGLITAGIMLFNTEALSAVFLQIANHSLVAIGLFLAAGILENRLNTRDLTTMGGIAKVAPKFAFWFAVTSLASMAVPFTSGFVGEFLILKELFSYHWIVGLLAASTLVFGAIYTLRAYQLSMYGAPKTSGFEDLKWNELVAFVLLSLVIVLLGIFPQIVLDFVGPSLDKIVTTIQTSKIQIK